ncbi:MAG: hypothetical protein COU07_02625 [Candidatus Harrisonbacteria bacterium CG10_big_fil_rev_8_21_14_0_10_40_38]|uniref:Type II secretion system protein GspG C-terminal domain-containing protein n=1 Tax=Candidatus Harrisonbacteria bacterium CG10_big_fil_rev_8_21_14_0_10_40_38 TaxID=1974583 RepID=A0A2H0URR3_9BACT|nr:MAG: hypothetical protein COU07_02625 [Candidatus Harrisonbacteria bacterium CG10_big_fil_rev_8_21_14_0_10_40_38]
MRKGFTLIELLIVIGILAILATTVVLVLNPAQILQESRDTQRVSDLGSVQSAIGLYLATSPSIDMDVANGTCATNWWSSTSATGAANQPFANPAVQVDSATLADSRAVDGNGWVAVNFGLVSGGSPLGSLPIDPSEDATNALDAGGHFYAYSCSATNTYEINGNMESAKFGNGGGSDVENTDGGNEPDIYEIGTEPGLDL